MLPNESNRSGGVAAAEGVVTADMIAQHAYCQRRLFLLYVDGRWADNEHTDAGAWLHRNADRREDPLPVPGDAEAPRVSRSVQLESDTLGLRAKLDLLERDDEQFIPVEIKRGRGPELGGTYEPERLQVATQGLLLREHGHASDHGIVYYAATRTRVRVEFGDEVFEAVLRAVRLVRDTLAMEVAPAPLVDSPKCPGCSVVGICLPDETHFLTAGAAEAELEESVRRLVPPRDDALPLYVQEQGAQVGKRGESLVVTRRGEQLAEVRLLDVSQLVLCGSIGVTPAAVQLLCQAGAPIVHLSMGHWFYGVTAGRTLRNSFDRAAQYARSNEPAFCLAVAKALVAAKGRNQRTLLRRNGPSDALVLDQMRIALHGVEPASSTEQLLGAEGNLAVDRGVGGHHRSRRRASVTATRCPVIAVNVITGRDRWGCGGAAGRLLWVPTHIAKARSSRLRTLYRSAGP